jgi:hypothetical protein
MPRIFTKLDDEWGDDMPDGPALAVLIAGALFFLAVLAVAFLALFTISLSTNTVSNTQSIYPLSQEQHDLGQE